MPATPSAREQKDHWDKWAIILAPLGGLLTALAVGSLGFFGSRYVGQQADREANIRLYSELLSAREQSEAALRKDMFQTIITSFLAGQSRPLQGTTPRMTQAALETDLLNLELLAQNFHESLSLAPLFYHVEREIFAAGIPAGAKQEYEDRLIALAANVSGRQLGALAQDGVRKNYSLSLDSLPMRLPEQEITFDRISRRVAITALSADKIRHRVEIWIRISPMPSLGGTLRDSLPIDAHLEVGAFDAPMLDNLRLSGDQRVAIVLTEFDASSSRAELAAVYFPGSHASMRERTYVEDIFAKLADSNMRLPPKVRPPATSTPPAAVAQPPR